MEAEAIKEQRRVDAVFGGKQPSIKGLLEVVNLTLEYRRSIWSFRNRCLTCREEGSLYDLIEAWYVQKYVPSFRLDEYFEESLGCRNPYAKFRAENKGFRIYTELDFLLEDIPVQQCSSRFDLGLTNDEVAQVLEDFLVKPLPLICPSLHLTHEENIAIAVVHVRLWLYKSHLPVVIGTSVSYAQLRAGVAFPAFTPLAPECVPSRFDVTRRETTVSLYWSMKLNPFKLYQPSELDFPESKRNCYWARMARIRVPHLRMEEMSASELATKLSEFEVDEDGTMEEDLEDWKWTESPVMYKLLAEVIYDQQV